LSIPDLIAARDRGERTSLWVTMPAKGLTLCSVTYPPEETLAARAEQTRTSRDKPRD
jgi:tRNA pseudouridine38-40 synthase